MSTIDHDASGQELRRDMRFSVTQAALIVRTGQPDIPCEIRDFCLGGLSLRFTQTDSNPEVAALDGADAVITFSPALSNPDSVSSQPIFRIPARLLRPSSSGVGVAFSKQPVDALRALQKLRMASHRQQMGASAVTASSKDLREVCTTLLHETLMQSHNLLSRMIGDKLTSAAIHAVSIAEHTGLLNAPIEFKTQASAVQAKLLRGVLGGLNQPLQTSSLKPAAPDGLSLVDEGDFEDWLSTSSEVTRLEEHFQEQLADIQPRISQLFALPFDHTSNPFGPSLICHAYRSAIQDMPLMAKARTVAYATLREVLLEQLAPLYAELLALLPVSESELAGHTSTQQDAHANSPHAGSAAPSASTPNAGSAASASAPQKGALGRLTGSLMDFFRGQSGEAASYQATPGLAASQGEAGATASQGGAGAPAQGRSNHPFSTPPLTRQNYAASPVLQRLSAAGSLPQNMNPEMRRSVDMFGALFDTLHAEKSVNEGIRPFFGQLEASLVKLAVSDPAFLASPSHPAHRVLNTLDRISMIAGDEGKIADTRLLRLMSRWTDRINAEAEKNPGIFEEARTQLERVVKPLLAERTARIARLQEICEGRQRAELTKLGVVAELLRRMGEREVPTIVIELINGGWRNVLLMAELRHGENSPEVLAAWQALEQLSLWLNQARSELPAPGDAQTLLQYIDTTLTHVCADKFAQDRMLDQLAHALFDQDESQHEYTTVSAKLRDTPPEVLSPGQDSLLERLRVGDWMQFPSLDAPLNLVWVGNKPPVYVFATYRGIKKLDIKQQDLLQSLEKNEAQWTEDMELPLMDRSYSAMIQKMQRDLMWQASHDPVTGLSNRHAFFRSIRRDWVRNKNTELDTGYVIGIIQIETQDTDGKPPSADTRNAFMREAAQLVQDQLPAGSLLARAGEQSIAYWAAMPDALSAKLASTKLLNALNRFKPSIDGHDIHANAHIGLVWASNGLDPERAYDNANAASTAARESGQAAVVLYQNSDSDRAKPVFALAEWAHELTRILAENRLELNCQAVLDLQSSTRDPVHYEILLHPVAATQTDSDQPINTDDLLSVAERLQRITEIDRWVFKQVVLWMQEHPDSLEMIGGFAIKLSGQSIVNPLFLNFLLAELGRGDVPAHKIIFSISEIAAADGHSQAQHFIRQLQRLGCKFMLDEFGLGNSSYTALKSLKLDYLKIDRSLVRELSASVIDEAIVRSILETSTFLDISTIAGFVESQDSESKLKDMGIPFAQGSRMSEPVALASLIQRLNG
ncbi:MAG: DUF1631 family protein [Thiobacillaceae bacterium]